MKIYNYSQSGVLLGSGIADESPLEPGVFAIPAFATTEEPPTVEEGFVAVFKDGSWSSVKNIIGMWFDNDGSSVYVTNLDQDVSLLCKTQKPTQFHKIVESEWQEDIAKKLEYFAAAVRSTRNEQLLFADYMVNTKEDSGESSQKWRQYRNFLRNVPEQAGFPLDVVWPEAPTE